MNMKKTTLLLLSTGMSAFSLHGQITTSFEADFSGSAPWNFDSETDPQSQLGGSGQAVYSFGATNDISYVEAALTTGPDAFGSFTVTGQVEVNFDIFQTDGFTNRYFLEIGRTGDGEQGVLDVGQPTLYRLAVQDFNTTEDKFRFFQNSDNRFWDSSSSTSSINNVGSNRVFDFEATISVIDAGGGQVTVSAETLIENSALSFSQTISSAETRDAGSGNSLSDVNSIRVGFEPNGTNPNTGTFEVNNISVVPEPSVYAIGFGLVAAGLVLLRRRRR